jgi:hypothetical protein
MTQTPASTSDFPDHLSPMLVKELRQGLRARTFVIVFLVLQAILAMVLLATASASGPDMAGQTISGIIFLCFGLAVLVIQPLRGISALSSEIKGNTLDLMVMTRLSAWRIVLGKWSALVGQSALLFTAIIPYLILRYFFGGMNLFGELMLFALVFLTSMLFTAITVSLSANSSVLIRGLLPLLASPFLIFAIIGFALGREIQQIVTLCTLTEPGSKSGLLATLVTGLAVGYSMLNLATSLIAPTADNHSTIRRLLSFVFLGAVALCGYFGGFRIGTMFGLAFIHAAPAIACSLTEGDTLLPPVVERFTRYGWAGRLFGRLFYPGWAAGTFYVILFLCAEVLMLWNHSRLSGSGTTNNKGAAILICLIGSLIFPAALLCFFRRKIVNRFQTYLFLLASSALLTLIISLITDATRSEILPWCIVWSPSSLLTFTSYPIHLGDDALLISAIIVNGCYLAILICAALFAFRKVSEVERQVLAEQSDIPDAPPSIP